MRANEIRVDHNEREIKEFHNSCVLTQKAIREEMNGMKNELKSQIKEAFNGNMKEIKKELKDTVKEAMGVKEETRMDAFVRISTEVIKAAGIIVGAYVAATYGAHTVALVGVVLGFG